MHCLIKSDGSNQAEFTVSYVLTVFFFFVCKIGTLLFTFSHAASPTLWTMGWLGTEFIIFQFYLLLSGKMWPVNVATRLGCLTVVRILGWNTVVLYVCTCFVPVIQNRLPILLGGKTFTSLTILSTVGNVVVATAVLVTSIAQPTIAVTGNISTTNMTSNSTILAEDVSIHALYALVVATAALFWASFALLLSTLSDQARKTFLSTESAKEYIKRVFHNFGRQEWRLLDTDVTEEYFKVRICLYFHSSFLPTNDVCAFIDDNRERWEREKPWFWNEKANREKLLECAVRAR